MEELEFFKYYTKDYIKSDHCILAEEYQEKYKALEEKIPELPFSNLWVAKQLSSLLPENSVLHLGIRNSLRSWGYFNVPKSVNVYSNTGGFGIDGGVSSLIGASLVHQDLIYFGVFGDLLFFYDINSLGNREISSNVRILLINNGLGQEFKNYSCMNSYSLGEEANQFIAAEGHNGKKSKSLVKGIAESLGFEYITASNKEEFISVYSRFITHEVTNSMIFEVFIESESENEALKQITTLTKKSKLMYQTYSLVPHDLLRTMKTIIGK